MTPVATPAQPSIAHPQIRRWHPRDLLLIGLMLMTLGLISVYLSQQSGGVAGEGAGWRRIDDEEVRQRIDSGRLSGHEAAWYHVGKAVVSEKGKVHD